MALQLRRGTDTERQTITFAEGELVYTTDTSELYIGDGNTLGGVLVSGSNNSILSDGVVEGSNYRINIVGEDSTIIVDSFSNTVTGNFVGDGSGLTNLPQSEGIVEGSNYRINIVGNDSSVMVNTDTNTFTGNFVGNGSGLSDIPGTIVEGSNYRINIVGDDSNIMVDTSSYQLATNAMLNLSADNIKYLNTGIDFLADTKNFESINFVKNRPLADLSAEATDRGRIYFSRNDINGESIEAIIGGGRGGLYLVVDDNQLFPENNVLFLDITGNVGLGTYFPETKLDVVGNAVIRGNLELNTGSLILDFTQSISTIPTPVAGQFIYDNDSELISFNDGFGWFTLPKTDELKTTEFTGAIILGATTSLERDEFGADSTAVSGAVLYNSTDDRFQFFQAGSWVNLINNGGSIGQLLAWNGTEWAAVDPEIASRTTVAHTTASLSDAATENFSLTMAKSFSLMSIEPSAASWVRLYVNEASRTADASRTQEQDPGSNSGVIAEVITTGAQTIILSPAIMGFNLENPVTSVIPCAITNLSGTTQTIDVNVLYLNLES